jgi:hypothetical protein
MENQMFTGIGCFAKSDRLGRIFNKLVQDYTLGPFEGHELFGKDMSTGIEGADLLQALMAGLTGGSSSGGYETISFQKHKKITGFYLSLNDQKLILSIFARGNSPRHKIYTTSLAELTPEFCMQIALGEVRDPVTAMDLER